MKFYGDYHTHSIFSRGIFGHHGKDTIFSNSAVAKAKGLKQIAVTEHGFSHLLYGLKRKRVPQVLNIIKESEKRTDIEILYGIEANIIDLDGTIDLTTAESKTMDVVLLGYHKFFKASNWRSFWNLFLPNIFKIKNNEQITRNTNAMINALNNYDIDVLTHMNAAAAVDVLAVARACIKNKVYVEINCKRMTFSPSQIDEMVKMGVKFIVNSDAHSAKRVGDLDKGVFTILKYNIPLSQIVNLNKAPIFKKHKQ